jgi:2-amino-4-hydroxy-6-hydroxymethyldihydropteridine diphosphokinase
MSEGSNEAYLGLGANLGAPEEQLARAVDQLGAAGVVEAVSSIYLTEPVGRPDQPPFLNLVCRISTSLPPLELLARIRSVEDRLGRVRRRRNDPRTIDIDILAYADQVLDTPDLVIPHPRMHARAFVLVPLGQIAPDWKHPVLGLTPAEMMDAARPAEKVAYHAELPR